MGESKREIEVKIHFESAEQARALLLGRPMVTVRERYFEDNIVFDREDFSLKSQDRLLRLRRIGDESLLTFKAPVPGVHRHKVRREDESHVDDPAALERILEGTGFRPVYRYQKYRTLYRWQEVEICLDETPIGCFVELEGPAEGIDRLAAELGVDQEAYLTESYRELHERFAAERGQPVGDLVFDPAEND